ncbi:MAG TPA: hypothetical protein PLI16_05035 [Bacteroidales bacterium]|nr:hypothetical protein [Bacteroidales bacterium]
MGLLPGSFTPGCKFVLRTKQNNIGKDSEIKLGGQIENIRIQGTG